MTDYDLKNTMVKTRLLGEAQGMMRGMISGGILPEHEYNVCQGWIDKVDKYFSDKLKETE